MGNKEYNLKELKIELTQKCNLNCIHCSSEAERKSEGKIEYNDCIRIVKQAIDLGVKSISFSGGEPLLWPNLNKIIQMVNDDVITCLYTTGTVDESIPILDNLIKSGLNRIIFSIYGSNDNTHEKVTLIKGSFNKTMDSIQHCLSRGIPTEIHFVPFPFNYIELPNIVNLIENLGIDKISILRFIPQGRGLNRKEELLLNNKQNLDLKKILNDLMKEKTKIRLGSPFNFLCLHEACECKSGIDRLTISPSLEISPCDGFKKITPNMLNLSDRFSSLVDNSLRDCWNDSIYLKRIREYVEKPLNFICDKCVDNFFCRSGCLAQKYHKYKCLIDKPDPMCLKSRD